MNIKTITTCAVSLMPGVAEALASNTAEPNNILVLRNTVYLGATLSVISASGAIFSTEESKFRRCLYGLATIASVGVTVAATNQLFHAVNNLK